jgi:hypothetical protein
VRAPLLNVRKFARARTIFAPAGGSPRIVGAWHRLLQRPVAIEPPKAHLDAALKEAAQIHPLDADGKESADGKIGLLSVGMSNTTMEYSKFKQLADADPAKAKAVVIIDGAQGGQTAMRWADTKSPLWQKVDERLTAASLSAKQIQVAWMKQAEAGPAQYGDFPKHANQLQENLVKDLTNLKEKFPNLRIGYLSSRIYAGYATTGLNPEPYAYEEAFTMRWLIQDQIAGKPELNYDPAKGAAKSPLLLWGPYLWADGETPRKADGLIYKREDLSDIRGDHRRAHRRHRRWSEQSTPAHHGHVDRAASRGAGALTCESKPFSKSACPGKY